jgi:hypothetical protein
LLGTLAPPSTATAQAEVPFHAEINRARKRLLAPMRKAHKQCLAKAKRRAQRQQCLEQYRTRKAPIAQKVARLSQKARQARLKCRERHDQPANLFRCRKEAWGALLEGLRQLGRK